MGIFFENNAIGIEIEGNAVRLMRIKKVKSGLCLSGYAQCEFPEGVLEKGNIKNGDKFRAALEPQLRTLSGVSDAVISLPEDATYLRVISLPKMSEAEAKRAALFEVENHIPLCLADLYLDLEIIDEPAQGLSDTSKVLILASPKVAIDGYIQQLSILKVRPVAFESRAHSLARALVKGKKTEQPLLIIDMSASKTNISIFFWSQPRFSASIPISVGHFFSATSRALGISGEEAKAKIYSLGFLKEGSQGQKIFESLIPAATDLAEQIKRYIDFYQNKNCGGKITKALLCGEGSNVAGLPDIFSSLLGIPCEIGDVWQNIFSPESGEIPDLSCDLAPKFAAAIGAAIRGASFDQELYD
ncbi:MAG TPA: pilus assembly protein PilM [Candidatus Pacearchaeota archaeon]|nr:pilus assembly protein PilM [Candidatus Pacearchaeota archaeon]